MIEPLGGETIVDLLVGPDIIKAIVPPAQQLSEGQAVWIKFDPDRIHLFRRHLRGASLHDRADGQARVLRHCLSAA